MKFALLALVTAGGLALSSGTASAQYRHGGYTHGGHLDYHNGHYHYHNGGFRSAPLVPVAPVYPAYTYPSYGSGFGLTIGGSRGVISIGSGTVYPSYGGLYSAPYYGGYGYGRRW